MSETANEEPGSERDRRSWRAAFEQCAESARQMLFPAPFRIHVPGDGAAESSAPADGTSRNDGQNADLTSTTESRHVLQTLAAVATALWRARTKLASEAKAELPAELRHLPRHIGAAWDALEAGGIQVQDHRDQRYVPGMAVNPITFQPVSGIGCEVIQETLKPSVFYKDILIQRADVIVARPLTDEAGAAHDATPLPPGGESDAASQGDQEQGPTSGAV